MNFWRSASGKAPFSCVLHEAHCQIHYWFAQSFSLERGKHFFKSVSPGSRGVPSPLPGIMGFQPISGVKGFQGCSNKITSAIEASAPLHVPSAS